VPWWTSEGGNARSLGTGHPPKLRSCSVSSLSLQEKIARLYDSEILPIWSEPFGRMLLDKVQVPPRSTILDAACGTGYPSLLLVKKLDPQTRIVAVDSSHEMLAVAREKAGPLSGKRIFFKHERIEQISFPANTFNMVISNCGILTIPDPRLGLREMVRVAKPGATVMVTFELRGSFAEFYDIFGEVLTKFDMRDELRRLDEYVGRLPDHNGALTMLREAGLERVDLETREFTLLFPSGREFFFSPLIEYGYLSDWKALVGTGEQMQRVFWHIKNAIDLYYQGRPYDVKVIAACAWGQKP